MRITKISFGEIPFRMFRDMDIHISERLTVIAGHNGIGKSTLLGLIANGSELKATFGKTLFNRPFQAQLHELFYLDEERDYVQSSKLRPSFQLHYIKDGSEPLIKTCNVSRHTDSKKHEVRLKVVPRGSSDDWTVGNEAKVPIPTMFLSMSRMLPIGEFSSDLKSQIEKKMDDEDRAYIRDKFRSIFDHKVSESSTIIKHELSSTTKRSLLPEFDHSTRTISLGQDSLSSIITALASFNHLKRIYGDYCGGILLIDEIDSGFHPKAQAKIIQLLKKEARRLNLQVIMTSHSLTVVKEVLNISDEAARVGRNIDSVVYIQDVLRPHLMEHVSYENVKRDMLSILPTPEKESPKIKVYFEDEEAEWIFLQILKYRGLDIMALYGIELTTIAAKLGCDNLRSLYEQDNYFKSVIIVFDGDAISNKYINNLVDKSTILILPTISNGDMEKDDLTPEYQIFFYLKSLLSHLDHPYWNNLPSDYNAELIKDTIIEDFPTMKTDKSLRVLRKEWFKTYCYHFEKTQLLKYLVHDYEPLINPFINDFCEAVKLLKSKLQV